MTRRWLGISLLTLTLLLAAPWGQALDNSNDTSAPHGDVTLTVYQKPGFGLVQDRRTLDLSQGQSVYALEGIAEGMIPDSLAVQAPQAPDSVQLVEHTLRRPDRTRQALLQAHIGETIRVRVAEAGRTYEGRLISAEDAIVLEDDDGRVQALQDVVRVTFPDDAASRASGPTLRLRLQSEAEGSQPVRMRYLSEGFAWQARYRAELSADRSTMTLTSTVSLANDSGLDVHDATLRLLAGEVQRVRSGSDDGQPQPEAVEARAAADDAQPPTAPSDYELYTLGRPADLPDGERVQQAFLPPMTLEPEVRYLFDARERDGVQVRVRTTNDNAADQALPSGLVRLYQERPDGSVFVGEDRIGPTPVGESIQLTAGLAFDLRAERTLTEREQLEERRVRESYAIQLTNRKDTDVTVRVREHLRGDWTITRSSLPFAQQDAQTITFDASVPAGGTTTVRYTVEFTP